MTATTKNLILKLANHAFILVYIVFLKYSVHNVYTNLEKENFLRLVHVNMENIIKQTQTTLSVLLVVAVIIVIDVYQLLIVYLVKMDSPWMGRTVYLA